MPRQRLTDDEHPGSFENLIEDAHDVEERCSECGLELHPEHIHLTHPPLAEPVIDEQVVHLTDGISDYGD